MKDTKMGFPSLIVRLMLALCLIALVSTRSALADSCSELLGGTEVTVIVVADPGDFSSTAEAAYLIKNLKNNVTVEAGTTLCPHIVRGTLMGQPAVVATSGIGPTAAALCVTDLLKCAAGIKEVIYMGTSGWSPKKGGLLNPPQCTALNAGRPIRIGDVCVSPYAINWACKKASWSQQSKGYPNQCTLPSSLFQPNASFLFGDCIFASVEPESIKLADEILAAVKGPIGKSQTPKRNSATQSWEKTYWSIMHAVNGLKAPTISASELPYIYDYTECMEIDAQFFYSGAPWEIEARHFTAIAMSMALKKTVKPTEVIAVSAMEAIGFAEAMNKYNNLKSTTRKIPFTSVRANSNWLHNIVKRKSKGSKVWLDTAKPVADDFPNGYKYAIASISSTVLSMLQQRCKASGKTGCTFTIDYS